MVADLVTSHQVLEDSVDSAEAVEEASAEAALEGVGNKNKVL